MKGGFAQGMGDVGGSIFVLIISLIFLCIALYGIVRPDTLRQRDTEIIGRARASDVMAIRL